MKNTKEKNYHPGHKAICPLCGKKVRGQYSAVTKFQYRCFSCYWAGDEPTFIKSVPNYHQEIHSISYTDIIKKMLSGASIRDQFEEYDLLEGSIDGREYVIRQKILRVYNAYSGYTQVPCEDPNFVKIKVSDDVRHLVISAIEEEETKIRNSPRLSIAFGK